MEIIGNIRFLITTVVIIITGAVLYLILSPAPEVTLRKDINKNPEKYNKIVKSVIYHQNQLPLGKLVAIERIPLPLKDELKKININRQLNYISVDKAYNCSGLNISLIYANYEVNYTPCPDSIRLKQNIYYKNGFIEVWNIDNNWSVILDSDVI
jgi:hypothetical protein